MGGKGGGGFPERRTWGCRSPKGRRGRSTGGACAGRRRQRAGRASEDEPRLVGREHLREHLLRLRVGEDRAQGNLDHDVLPLAPLAVLALAVGALAGAEVDLGLEGSGARGTCVLWRGYTGRPFAQGRRLRARAEGEVGGSKRGRNCQWQRRQRRACFLKTESDVRLASPTTYTFPPLPARARHLSPPPALEASA